jgi:hypothetical protein
MRQKPKIHEIEFGFEDLNYPKVVVFYEFNFELDMILVARCRGTTVSRAPTLINNCWDRKRKVFSHRKGERVFERESLLLAK